MAQPGLAIVAGHGVLPRLLAEDCVRCGRPYRVVVFEGISLDWTPMHPVLAAEFEKPGRLFADLRSAGCRSVTFAGAMHRPVLNPLRFDFKMLRLAPKLTVGLRAGDDTTLRLLAEIFEAEGISLLAPQAILSNLMMPEGVITRARPSDADRRDAERAAAIVTRLGAADVGQGAVVAQGLCLGLESIQGTDAMLAFVERTARDLRPDPAGSRGVLYKCPKPEQDWRVDLPAIGPQTLRASAAAGLAGVAVQAHGVLLLDRAEAVAAADALGLFIWGRAAE